MARSPGDSDGRAADRLARQGHGPCSHAVLRQGDDKEQLPEAHEEAMPEDAVVGLATVVCAPGLAFRDVALR